MANFTEFIRNIQKRGGQVEDGVNKIVRAVALEVDSSVVQATPVLTGRARSNWRVNFNSPASGEVGEGSVDKSGNTAISQGSSAIGKYNLRTVRAIHITNNVPYIGDLNRGSSPKAPANFVGMSVARGAQVVRTSRLFR